MIRRELSGFMWIIKCFPALCCAAFIGSFGQELSTTITLSEGGGLVLSGVGPRHRSYELIMSHDLNTWIPGTTGIPFLDQGSLRYGVADDFGQTWSILLPQQTSNAAFFRFVGREVANHVEMTRVPDASISSAPLTAAALPAQGEYVTYVLSVDNTSDLTGVSLDLWFDPQEFSFIEARGSDFLFGQSGGNANLLPTEIEAGHLIVGAALNGVHSVSGSGELIRFVFQTKTRSTTFRSGISFSRLSLSVIDRSGPAPVLKFLGGNGWTQN